MRLLTKETVSEECPWCKGSGDLAYVVGRGPDTYEEIGLCCKCGGTGEVKNTMRIWLDCEFNGWGGELISIALIDETGRSFYEAVAEYTQPRSEWVELNVIPVLGKTPISRSLLQENLGKFLSKYEGKHLEFISDWPCDFLHLCDLLVVGPGLKIGPTNFSMTVLDIKSTSKVPHNALEDAMALREVCLKL